MNGPTLLVAISALAVQPSAASDTAATIVVRKADAGRLIPVRSGQHIVIQLNSLPGSMNQWRVRSLDRLQQVAPVDSIADPLRSVGAIGDPRVAAIRLRGGAPGDASALIEEAPIGGGYGSNYLRFRFRVQP